jgi:hypothetical protein
VQSREEYAEDIKQQVQLGAEQAQDGEFLEDAFTRLVGSMLTNAGETDDPAICAYRGRGMKVNGYALDQDQTRLDLLVSDYHGLGSGPRISRSDVQEGFRRLGAFVTLCLSGRYKALEESSAAYDLALTLNDLRQSLDAIRMIYVTDGIAPDVTWPDGELEGLSVRYDVWDLARLYRLDTSGRQAEPIDIDLQSEYHCSLPCLSTPRPDDGYQAYLLIVPGAVLAKIYSEYGPRLLERNVRSFLQVKNKVNKGIRDTIIGKPSWFLAYNNGITATADSVRFSSLASGGQAIARISNLQIVNGGQTTASLARAADHDGADLTAVSVQCKLCVVPESRLDEVVPDISMYANSQNKVNTADFRANDRFQVELEKLSRSIWAPARKGQSHETHWFYERARGQYADARAKEGATKQRLKAFDSFNPRDQWFTKTDLAKFVNAWGELPHLVSLGAEKNFNHYVVSLGDGAKLAASEDDFRAVVAQGIIFRYGGRIIRDLKLGGYGANIVAYTVAFIAYKTAQRIDLRAVWKEQSISTDLERALQVVAPAVRGVIMNPPEARNITEWCKKKQCWEEVQKLSVDYDWTLLTGGAGPAGSMPPAPVNPAEEALVKEMATVPSETWFAISAWAKQTGNLQPWQRGIAYSLGGLAQGGRRASVKQATQGKRILEEATRLGFLPEGVEGEHL